MLFMDGSHQGAIRSTNWVNVVVVVVYDRVMLKISWIDFTNSSFFGLSWCFVLCDHGVCKRESIIEFRAPREAVTRHIQSIIA